MAGCDLLRCVIRSIFGALNKNIKFSIFYATLQIYCVSRSSGNQTLVPFTSDKFDLIV